MLRATRYPRIYKVDFLSLLLIASIIANCTYFYTCRYLTGRIYSTSANILDDIISAGIVDRRLEILRSKDITS